MKGKTTATAAVVIALAAPASAGAAALSPSAQFAYNVATASRGAIKGCDVQMVPTLPGDDVAEYNGAPCRIYLSRSLASSAMFAKTCQVLVSVLAILHGEAEPTRLAGTCLTHEAFLLNHPGYLRRFR